MTAYIFPGQGSQKKGMGKDFFDANQDLINGAEKILGYNVKDLCQNDPDHKLAQTQYTQPMLYIVNALMWLDVKKQLKQKPDYFAGHSLGEYNALLAANTFDFDTGLKLVQKRGQLMSEAKNGGMAALIGFDENQVREVLEKNNLNNIFVANLNSPSQIVISGLRDEIDQSEAIFKAAGLKLFIKLKVSGAFHTKFMSDAEKEFSTFIDQFSFHAPEVPVISNVTGLPYDNTQIKELLCKQMISPVRWLDSIQYLLQQSVDTFKEVGPGNVLTNLVKKIKKETPAVKKNDTIKEAPVNQITKESELIEKKKTQPVKTTIENTQTDQAESQSASHYSARTLGSQKFKALFNLQYAYYAGGMYRGISSKEMVIRMGKAGMLSFLGTGGMSLQEIESDIIAIQKELGDHPYGMNFIHHPTDLAHENRLMDLFLKYQIKTIEASAFVRLTPALVKYRLSGLSQKNGNIHADNKIIAKLSRPEIAAPFLSPAPEKIVNQLLKSNQITEEQARWSQSVPMADAICAESDSGGHTDGAVAFVLIPSMIRMKDKLCKQYQYSQDIFIGAAGGIGTPEAAAASFLLGADFIVTGSINQCTVEAGTSDQVKDLLQQMNIQDTTYAPAGDMFEMGAKVQVLRKGVLFPARANKLYDLYRLYQSLDDIDLKTQQQIQEKFFKKSFADVYDDVKQFFHQFAPDEITKAEQNPKHKMALIFRWFFNYTSSAAQKGQIAEKANFQIHTGPALGAFNRWVEGTELENWKNRHVDLIGLKIINDAALFLNRHYQEMKRV